MEVCPANGQGAVTGDSARPQAQHTGWTEAPPCPQPRVRRVEPPASWDQEGTAARKQSGDMNRNPGSGWAPAWGSQDVPRLHRLALGLAALLPAPRMGKGPRGIQPLSWSLESLR